VNIRLRHKKYVTGVNRQPTANESLYCRQYSPVRNYLLIQSDVKST